MFWKKKKDKPNKKDVNLKNKKQEIVDSDIPNVIELLNATENSVVDMDKIEKLRQKFPDHEIYQDIIDPREFTIRNQALGYAMAKQPEKSIEFANEGLKINPNSPFLHYLKGRTLCDMGKFEEGLDHLITATKLKPIYADAYSEIGSTYFKLGDYEDAEKVMAKAHELDPSIKVWKRP
jgi:tetratricopeptide (TPR) repeat protein